MDYVHGPGTVDAVQEHWRLLSPVNADREDGLCSLVVRRSARERRSCREKALSCMQCFFPTRAADTVVCTEP